MKTERAFSTVNGMIRYGLRSEPSLEGGRGGGERGLYGLAVMWKRMRYCPSHCLISVQGRRGRSSQLGQISMICSRGDNRGRGWRHWGWPCALGRR